MEGENIGNVYSLFRISDSKVTRDISGITKTVKNILSKFPEFIVKTNLKDSEIRADVKKVDAIIKDKSMDVKVNVGGFSAAMSELQKIDAAVTSIPNNVEVKVNTPGSKQTKKELNEIKTAAEETGKSISDIGAGITAAAGVVAGVGATAGFFDVEKTNKQLDTIEARVKTINPKISDAEINQIKEGARTSFIQTGQDITEVVEDTIKLYTRLQNAEKTASTQIQLGQASIIKGFNPSDSVAAYSKIVDKYKQDDPGKVARNFAAWLIKAQNVDLSNLDEAPGALDGAVKSSDALFGSLTRLGETQIDTNKALDAWKTFTSVTTGSNPASLDFISTFLASDKSQKFVEKIQDSYSKFSQLNPKEQQILTAFAATQHANTESIFEALRDGDAATIAAFHGSQDAFVQSIRDGKVSQADLSKALSEKFAGLSDIGKLNFTADIGIGQFQDLGIEGTGKLLDTMANVNAQTAQFAEENKNAGKVISDQYDATISLGQQVIQIWKDFSTSEGVQTLLSNVVPTINKFVDWLDRATKSISDFMVEHPKMTQSIFWSTTALVAVIAILGTFVGAIIAAGSIVSWFSTAVFVLTGRQLVLSSVLSKLGKGLSIIGRFFGSVGRIAMWFARFAIGLVIDGLEALAAAIGVSVGWVVAIVAAIVAAGLLIWGYWNQLVSFFSRSVDMFKKLGPKMLAIAKNIGLSFLQGLITPMRLASNLLGSVFKALGLPSGVFDDIQKLNDKLQEMKADVSIKDTAEEAFSMVKDNAKQTGQEFGDRTKELVDGAKAKIGGLLGGLLPNGKKEEKKQTELSTPDSGTSDLDKLTKELNDSNATNADAILKALEKNKAPTADNIGTKGLKTSDTKPVPVNQTNIVYNPYDEAKVNNSLNTKKKSGELAIGRRAVPTCS